jgi:hypothetical protein
VQKIFSLYELEVIKKRNRLIIINQIYFFAEFLDGITEALGQDVSFRQQWRSTYISDILPAGRRWWWDGHKAQGSGRLEEVRLAETGRRGFR